jgi:hypothetical protein
LPRQSNDENKIHRHSFDKDEQGNINKLSYKNYGNQLVKLLNPENLLTLMGKMVLSIYSIKHWQKVLWKS